MNGTPSCGAESFLSGAAETETSSERQAKSVAKILRMKKPLRKSLQELPGLL
jgi:hypothetical protein